MALEYGRVGGQISSDVFSNWEKHSKFDENCRHTRAFGKPGKNNEILYEKRVRKQSEGVFGKASHTFTYSCAKGERITAAIAYDEWDDGTGGYPELQDGGIGEKTITVEVTSQYLRGFHHQFVVYGTTSKK